MNQKYGSFIAESADSITKAKDGLDNKFNKIDYNGLKSNSAKAKKKIKGVLSALREAKRKNKKLTKEQRKPFYQKFLEVAKTQTKAARELAALLPKGSLAGLSTPKSSALDKAPAKIKEKIFKKTKAFDDSKIGAAVKSYRIPRGNIRKNSTSDSELRNELDQNYDIKVDDITKSDGASLWKLIHNRYLQSAYPKLFKKK